MFKKFVSIVMVSLLVLLNCSYGKTNFILAEDDENYYEEEYYEEIVNERPQTIERPEVYEQQVTREKSIYRVKVNTIMATLFVSALIVFVMSAFYYLNVKSQISETGKQIKKAEAKLGDTAKCEEDVLSYIAFPPVAENFFEKRREREEKVVRYTITEA